MSVGETVYTSDDRVVVTHKKHSTDWILQFKFAKERDEGMYECQVTIPWQTIKLEHFWGYFQEKGSNTTRYILMGSLNGILYLLSRNNF